MNPPQDLFDGIMVLVILVGAVQCFFGYRLFRVILGLSGFLFGGFLAGTLGYTFSQEEVVAILLGLVGGIAGAGLMAMLYFVGIFLFGAFLGGILGGALFTVIGIDPAPVVLLLIPAVIAGVVALFYQRLMIILSTGFGGAWSVVTGIAYFVTGAGDPAKIDRLFNSGGGHSYAFFLCWLGLGVAGVIVQHRSTPASGSSARPG